MIVKDSTANQVHNDSTKIKTTTKKKNSSKRLRSDASESLFSCQPQDLSVRSALTDTRQTQVSATHVPLRRGLRFLFLLFGLDSFQKKKFFFAILQ